MWTVIQGSSQSDQTPQKQDKTKQNNKQKRELQKNFPSEKASTHQMSGLGSGETQILTPAEEEMTSCNKTTAAPIAKHLIFLKITELLLEWRVPAAISKLN